MPTRISLSSFELIAMSTNLFHVSTGCHFCRDRDLGRISTSWRAGAASQCLCHGSGSDYAGIGSRYADGNPEDAGTGDKTRVYLPAALGDVCPAGARDRNSHETTAWGQRVPDDNVETTIVLTGSPEQSLHPGICDGSEGGGDGLGLEIGGGVVSHARSFFDRVNLRLRGSDQSVQDAIPTSHTAGGIATARYGGVSGPTSARQDSDIPQRNVCVDDRALVLVPSDSVLKVSRLAHAVHYAVSILSVLISTE